MIRFSKYAVMSILLSKVVALGYKPTTNIVTKLCPIQNDSILKPYK